MRRFLDGLSELQRRHALLWFLALGAALFTIDHFRHRPAPLLAAAPAEADRADAERWLEDEVLYREALARGLDDGDLIVRRRLAQKMRLLLEAGVNVPDPDETTLRRWIDAHAQRYGGLTRLSFDHVFLSRGRHDAHMAADAAIVAQKLKTASAADLAALSDPHPGGTVLDKVSGHDVERLFGSMLAQQLAEVPAGDWQGPLPSALGLHFVRIRERHAEAPDYSAVRARALRDYLLEQRRIGTQLALDELKAHYGLQPATATP